MKKTNFAVLLFSLFVHHALGQERELSGDEYAIQQQKKLEGEMLKSGFLSSLDYENLKKEKDEVSNRIEKALQEEDHEKIEECSKILSGYLDKMVFLEEEFIKYKKNPPLPLR